LEYIEGITLLSLLSQSSHPQISLYEIKRYIVDIIHALEHIHSRGFCYLDLKPENVIATTNSHIKLVDFGCSKKVNEKRKNLSGTLVYLAPEILEGNEYGIEVDY
jgi:serine/threonine protein kinase